MNNDSNTLGHPRKGHSGEDLNIRSDIEWYKRVLDTLDVHVTTAVPYIDTSGPSCKRQNRVVEQNRGILMKQQCTKDWVRLLPWGVLVMRYQESSPTGYTPHELFNRGGPASSFKTPFPEDHNSPVEHWLEHKQDLANIARATLIHVCEGELTRRNPTSRPASFKVGDVVLVHHLQLSTWPRNCLQDPSFRPYRISKINGSRIHVRCSPRLGRELLCAPKELRHYHSPD